MSDTNKSKFAPFLLTNGENPCLILSDDEMSLRFNVFQEKESEGWLGNGYDWTSIAQVVLDEKIPDLKDKVEFDPEAGMFCALGAVESLERLGEEMKKVFDDPNLLRDLLSRAKLD